MNTQEADRVRALRAEGYVVEVINPNGKDFKEKYVVYRDMKPLGKRLAIIDKDGNIIGHQG